MRMSNSLFACPDRGRISPGRSVNIKAREPTTTTRTGTHCPDNAQNNGLNEDKVMDLTCYLIDDHPRGYTPCA
jgi:hypothetical protein